MVALSTAEAEFVSMSSAMQELLWLRTFHKELSKETEMILHCDNKSAICMANNKGFNKRTKHIDVRHNFLRDCIRDKCCSLEYMCSEDMLADIFTKPLPRVRFEMLRRRLNVLPTYEV